MITALLLAASAILTYHGIRESNRGKDWSKNIAFALALAAFITAIIFMI